MSHRHDHEPTLRISSNEKESVDIQLESSTHLTIQVQVDGGCNCQHGTGHRPGSYVDSDLGLR